MIRWSWKKTAKRKRAKFFFLSRGGIQNVSKPVICFKSYHHGKQHLKPGSHDEAIAVVRTNVTSLLGVVDTLLMWCVSGRVIVHRTICWYAIRRAIGYWGNRLRVVVLVWVPRWSSRNSRVEHHPITFLCNRCRASRGGSRYRWLWLMLLGSVNDIVTGCAIRHWRGAGGDVWGRRRDESAGVMVHGLWMGHRMHLDRLLMGE